MKQALIVAAFACLVVPIRGVAAEVEYLGRASCAASTCHGSVVDRGQPWNHSLSTWFAKDPHAGAGLLLRDEDSRQIVEALNPAAANFPETFDEVLRTRCISCHTTATPKDCAESGLLDDVFLAEGVSCESCHGAAGAWLDPHVGVAWSGPQRFQGETRMIDTESIIGRAKTCVRCHVGSRTEDALIRDMNHDLIAAGHPALRFDLLIYNENLPKHWDQTSEVETKFNESAIRVRSVSRAINLATAATLSAERASDHMHNRSVPWPELADYDCFACHQSLSIGEYRLPTSGRKKSPLHVSDGLPIWNAWHTINQLDMRDNKKALETLSPHLSKPKQVARLGKQIAVKYETETARRMTENSIPKEVLRTILQQLRQQPPVDWYQAAIQYLEIDAALRDLARDESSAAETKQIRESFRRSEQLLRFDPTRSDDQVARYHSPLKFNPEAFQASVLDALGVQPIENTPPAINANTPTNQ